MRLMPDLSADSLCQMPVTPGCVSSYVLWVSLVQTGSGSFLCVDAIPHERESNGVVECRLPRRRYPSKGHDDGPKQDPCCYIERADPGFRAPTVWCGRLHMGACSIGRAPGHNTLGFGQIA